METSILTFLSTSPLSHSQLVEALKNQQKEGSGVVVVELPVVNQCIKKLCDCSTIASHKFGDVEVYYLNTSPSSSSSSKPTNHLAGGLSASLKSRLSKKIVAPRTVNPPQPSTPKKFKPPLLSSSSSSSSTPNSPTPKGTKRTIIETETEIRSSSTNKKEEVDPFITQKKEIESLFAERKKLQTLIAEKEKQLKSFGEQPISKGTNKSRDEGGRVAPLIKKWVSICQTALLDLEKKSLNEEGKPVMTVAQIISTTQIDPKLVRFDVDSETFE